MFFCRLKFVLKLINHSCAKTCSTHTPASLTKWLKIIFLSPNKKRKERKRVFHLQYWEVITREKDGRQIQSLERLSGTICEQTKDYNLSLFTKLEIKSGGFYLNPLGLYNNKTVLCCWEMPWKSFFDKKDCSENCGMNQSGSKVQTWLEKKGQNFRLDFSALQLWNP